jgi:hypothetical protein
MRRRVRVRCLNPARRHAVGKEQYRPGWAAQGRLGQTAVLLRWRRLAGYLPLPDLSLPGLSLPWPGLSRRPSPLLSALR